MSAYESGWYGRSAPAPRATPRHRSPAPSDISDIRDGSLSLGLEETTLRSDRVTPYKFCDFHPQVRMGARGLMVCGTGRAVSVVALASCLADDSDTRQLLAYPGPLVKGVTHKKRVVEYCLERAEEPGAVEKDRVGYELVWRLLALLLTHNGAPEPADVAELLMQSERAHPTAFQDESESMPPTPAAPSVDSLAVYRNLLLVGNHTDALETACAAGLWGHALVLAEALGARARAAALARFLAALPRADPLHTLYCATARRPPPPCGGDWRPHLAMLLIAPDSQPQLQAKHIQALGDNLNARGLPYSAQLCYLMSGEPFGRHALAPWLEAGAPPSSPLPRLSLLLSTPRDTTFAQFARTPHIASTEIYEYARSLNSPDFVIPQLQAYKWWAACRLAECGQGARALRYAEQVARAVLADPAAYPSPLQRHLADLAERLWHSEGEVAVCGEQQAADGSAEPVWLTQLSLLQQQIQESRERSQHSRVHQTAPPGAPAEPSAWQLEPPAWQPEALPLYNPDATPAWQPDTVSTWQPDAAATWQHEAPPAWQTAPDSPVHQPRVPPDPLAWSSPITNQPEAEVAGNETGDASYSWSATPYNQEESGAEQQRPRITMPGDRRQERRASEMSGRSSSPPPPSAGVGGAASGGGAGSGAAGGEASDGGGGWLGNIFTKLSLKPKNQMILPDDKNPTIVWDAERRRWRNTEQDEQKESSRPPPPPRVQLPGGGESVSAEVAAGGLYKMQKGRLMKKCYVDVLKPSGPPTSAPPPPPAPAPHAPAPPFFVPSP